MRILTTQERIELGQAKNQASALIGTRMWSSLQADFFEEYKRLTMLFFKANKELDAEIMEAGESKTNPPIPKSKSQPSFSKEDRFRKLEMAEVREAKETRYPAELDSKHIHCPKCRKPIFKTWKRHDECGWAA